MYLHNWQLIYGLSNFKFIIMWYRLGQNILKFKKTYLFFIHFEKNNADCIGELKGTLTLSSTTAGQFTQNGDPCIIDFSFSGNSVSLKEQGTCGNHRGIKCLFDDSFTRKKPSKSKKKLK